MLADHAIEDVGRAIATQFNPERVILFGSYAYGSPRPDSDVDLLVVMPYKGTPLAQAAAIAQAIRTPFTLDVIVRSAEELRQRVEWNDRFTNEILSRGRILYAADHN